MSDSVLRFSLDDWLWIDRIRHEADARRIVFLNVDAGRGEAVVSEGGLDGRQPDAGFDGQVGREVA